MGIGRGCVVAGTREVEDSLAPKRLGGRPVREPVLVVLVEVEDGLDDDDECAEHGRNDEWRAVDACDDGDRGRGDDLGVLQPLERALVSGAARVVPCDLTLEALPDNVCQRRSSSTRVGT